MTTTAPMPPKTERKRGRETAADMVRSLALVMLVVVGVWFFAKAPSSDERPGIQVIDPAPQVATWTAAVEQAPVPRGLPDTWRPTSAYYDPAPDRLRIGHVTPGGRYAEFAASTAPAQEVVPQLTGEGTRTGTVDVAGQPWESYEDGDGSLSLVRRVGGTTVVVGTLRSTAPVEELVVLAASVVPDG